MEIQARERLRRQNNDKIMEINKDRVPDGWKMTTETDTEITFEDGSEHTVILTESFSQGGRFSGTFIHRVRMDGPDGTLNYSGFRDKYSDGRGAFNCARNVMRTITALQE